MTILFFSDIAWSSLYQRPQHIASRLARKNCVIWVEPATLGRPWYFTPKEELQGLFRLTLPMFPLNARSAWVRRIAGRVSRIGIMRTLVLWLQGRLLRRGLRRIRRDDGPLVCLVENFLLIQLADFVSVTHVLFDYIDDAFGFNDAPPFVREEWRKALRRADTITATSPTLKARIVAEYPCDVHLVPNGVEYERFAAAQETTRPADLPPSDSPVIGYVGSVYPWLDFDLLVRAADTLTDLRFVLIGHAHPSVYREIARLQQRANVRYLGLKPYDRVPAYLACFSVGIIPFRRSRLTEGVNPVKLYEYCAVGIPTVVTDFSDDMRGFKDLVLIARSGDEFMRHIRAAVARHADPEEIGKLRTFARQNDWDERAREMSSFLHRSI